jgi:hypothetical protein
MKCEVALQAANVRAEMQEQYKAGLRQGMKGRVTFGAEKSTEMTIQHSLLPKWDRAEDNTEHVGTWSRNSTPSFGCRSTLLTIL